MKLNKILLSLVFFCISQSVFSDEIRNVDLLASACSSCHGTQGHSVAGTPSLAGLDKLHFMQQMNSFISKSRNSTVMHHHASGYSAHEIELLAEFFAKQK